MEYIIDTGQATSLAWDAKGNNRILQNVANLIKTFQYEVAYDRLIGINPDVLDRPFEEAFVMYSAEVYRVVGDFEPRAKVIKVVPAGIDQEGNIRAQVVVEI